MTSRRFRTLPGFGVPEAPLASLVSGVGKNPEPFSDVPGIDRASRNTERPCGVASTSQVRKHLVEPHDSERRHVLKTYPSGPRSFDSTEHLRPEPAVIRLAEHEPGKAERLARESGREQPDTIEDGDVPHIAVVWDMGPESGQISSCIGVCLCKSDGLHAVHLSGDREASQPGAEVKVRAVHLASAMMPAASFRKPSDTRYLMPS